MVAIVGLMLAAGAFEWLVPPTTANAVVFVAPGSGRARVAARLTRAGVVREPVLFLAWALAHPQERIRAGTFRFSGPQPIPAVLDTLARGPEADVQLVVPEGFNRFDIARELERKHLASAADFLAATADPTLVRGLDPAAVSLEGYLFPDTYVVAPGTPATAIAAMMVARFRRQVAVALAPAWPPRLGPYSDEQTAAMHAWVTMGSLIEKETAVPAERPVIAGVFMNRLARNVRLQCDPTVIYAALLAGDYQGTIRSVDLRRASPYNTYRQDGLPPGPIANPGMAALRAAMHPATTPYLYFVSNDAGGHRFAATLAEQQRNVKLYERARADHAAASAGH